MYPLLKKRDLRSALVLFLLVLIFVLLVLIFLLVLVFVLFVLVVLLIVLVLHNEYSFFVLGYVLIMPRINRFYANFCYSIAIQGGRAKRTGMMRMQWWKQLLRED